MAFVYLIENNITGKMYVGYTSLSPEERWRQHLEKMKSTRRGALYDAMRKYGPENFTMFLLEYLDTKEAAEQAEIFWIESLATISPTGYNLTKGGTGGAPSQEIRRKISASLSGEKHPNFGKNLSEETRNKISSFHKGKQYFLGRVHTQEAKDKISAAKMGNKNGSKKRSPDTCQRISASKVGAKNPMYNRKLSEDTKEKMRQSQLARWAKKKAQH